MNLKGEQKRGTGAIIQFLGVAGYLLLVFGPPAALLIKSLTDIFSRHPEWVWLAIPSGNRVPLFIKTLGLSTAVALGGTLIGLLVGLFLFNQSTQLRILFRWLVIVLAPLPPYIHALAWKHLTNIINQGLSISIYPRITLRGWGASWWVWMLSLAPFSISLVLLGLESIDRELVEAARLRQPDGEVFKHILLPLIRPYLYTSTAMLFLLSFTDYSISSLFQTTSYPLSLFADFSAHHQAGRIMLLSMPMLLVGISVIAILLGTLRKTPLNPVWRKNAYFLPFKWPGWLNQAQGVGFSILILQILVPIFSFVSLNRSWPIFSQNILAAKLDIRTTLLTSILAAAGSLPVAYAIANYVQARENRGISRWIITVLPLAIPPPLIGIGLIMIWNQSFFPGIYNSWIMPTFASLARFTPFGVFVILSQLRTLNPELLEAANVLQKNSLRKWLWIKLPLLAPGLIASAFFVFVLSLGELGATLLVVPAGRSTLTIRIYNFLHYGASDTVASLGLIITSLALLFGFLAVLILSSWSRLLAKTS